MAEMDILNKKRLLLWSFFFLFLIFLVLLAFQDEETTEKKDTNGSIRVSLEKIELVHTKKGKKDWKLIAKKSQYYKGTEIVDLVEPVLTFYLPEEEKVIKVTAQEGKLEQRTQKVRLNEKIRVHYTDSILKAEEMEYLEKTKQILLRGNVRLINPKMRIRGKSASFDINRNILKIEKKVKVTFYEDLYP